MAVIRSREKSEPFVFKTTVAKNSSVKLTEKMEIKSRAVRLQIIIPPGPEGALRIRAYFKDSKNTPREFVNFIGDENYFDGDDIPYDIPLDVPVEAKSTLYVEAENLSPDFDYSLNVIINVEYDLGEQSA